MTFLNPAVLIGLVAAAIPIVLHFLNLRKLKTIEFSTLTFLKELQKTKIKKIKLKQWLLLLIRVLIILLLVFAFARPTIKTVTFGNSSAAKTTAVIILDNTFSMSIVEKTGSRLNSFKKIAKNLLNNLQSGDEVALITVGNNKPIIASSNFSLVKKEIDDLDVSNVSGTLNEALIKSSQVLYASKNFSKEVYILSDLQKSRLVNFSADISNFGKTFTPETRFYFFDAKEVQAVNLGIEDLKPNNQIYELGKEISFSAVVKNYSGSASKENVISFFINGKRAAQKNVSLGSGEAKEISFETTLQDTGLVEFSAELEDDEILQDNKRFYSINIPSKINLLLLYDKPDDTKFIKLALEASSKIKLTEMRLEHASNANLQKYDAIIIVCGEGAANNSFPNYLTSGGSIVVFPSSLSTQTNFQKILGEFSIKVLAQVGKINSPDSFTQFAKTDFQHPLLKNIFEEKSKAQIESPEIFSYYKISSSGKNIISLIDNSPFLSEHNVEKGKLILFSSAPVLSWNTFPVKAFFAPIITKTINYCAIKSNQDTSLTAGNEFIANISNAFSTQIRITSPALLDEFFNSDSLINKKYLPYKNTTELGTYSVYSGTKLLDYFSVNHDRRESLLESSTEEQVKDYLKQIGFEGKEFFLSKEKDYLKEIYQSRFGTELWKYFLILALIFTIIESLLARSTKKDLAV